jgi:polyhydroxybutyrate depolymerase
MPHRLPIVFLASWIGLVAADGIAAEPSPGCGTPPARSPQTFEVDGRERHALVVLPENYRSSRPHPLVFAFHGRTNDHFEARRYFDLEAAARAPTIYVYPAALKDRSGRFAWSEPSDPPDALRDFAFFDIMLDRLAASYCIDLDAVYAVGHSLGASFANSLACARGHRLRGVASVGGGVVASLCWGAPAALLLHNPRDQAVPLREGERARDVLLGDPGDDWVRRRIGAFECRLYDNGANPLFWCPHGQDVTPRGRFYPHQWPQGAPQAIAAFFDLLVG